MRIITIASLLLVCAPAIGGEIKVTWLPNTEPDLAGYFLYYGTEERPQRHRLDVGRQTQYLLQDLEVGITYFITVTAADREGNESLFAERITVRIPTDQEKNGGSLPQHYLLQNYPNPFQILVDKNTAITFSLSEDSPVKLEIFNVLGQRLITLFDQSLKAGTQKIFWNGLDAQKRPVPAGIYVYRLETSGQISTRKLVVYR